jgi:hypothetical protein
MCCYIDKVTDQWFRKAWAAAGKKLDMGKSCVRFKKLEDVSLEVIGQVIARVSVKNYIARMEQVLGERPRKAAKKTK